MNKFKRQLDEMMGDTSAQERRIQQNVRQRLHAGKQSKRALFIAAALPVTAMLIILSIIPSNFLQSAEGPSVPYDPLNDLAEISALQKKQQLSSIDYETFASLPVIEQTSALQYIDEVPFTLAGSSETFHTVIERKANLFDDIVYTKGGIVRTMTNTTSHLPTYIDTYYEVLAVPGDRVKLAKGELTINGKPAESELLAYYDAQQISIAGGYEQLLNAREYFLLNRFPAPGTLQGAAITPVHKIFGEVTAVASEQRTESMYFDYLQDELSNRYSPAQYFDLYLYDELFGTQKLPQMPAFAQTSRLGELFIEASYRKELLLSETEAEIRYEYGRKGVAEQIFAMEKDRASGAWLVK